jgi:NAD(P)-dependent dehydrogenase (short-subunit alcohol dehydrogenase family)
MSPTNWDAPGSARTEREGPLAGKTALVTGASRGIGEAVARGLAGLGARVGVAARSERLLEGLATTIGGWALPGDLSAEDGVGRMLAAFRRAAGGDPDILVASAGVFTLAAIEETTPEALQLNWTMNVRTSFLCVKEVLPGMKSRGSGTIVQVGSVAGRKAFPANGAYSASKFGVRGFHEVLLEELRGTGVRATLIEPGATDTPIWDPMAPDEDPDLPPRSAMLRPHDVAEAVSFVATRPEGVQIPFLPIERG